MHLTREHIDSYCLSLLADERSAGTISKYRRDLTAFAHFTSLRHSLAGSRIVRIFPFSVISALPSFAASTELLI